MDKSFTSILQQRHHLPTHNQVGEGGEATVSPSRPEGTTKRVTITTNPDQGMEVDKVSVTDRYGNTVEVTNNGDGTYSLFNLVAVLPLR